MSSEEKRIKSSLEIALERVEKLGKLSAEESRRLKETELASAGEGLARRYLAGLLLRDVEIELGKYGEKEREVLVRYVGRGLLEAIDLDHAPGLEKVLEGLSHLVADAASEKALRELLGEYDKAGEEAWQEAQGALAQARREELEEEGISGSSVVPNLKDSPEWRQTQQQLRSLYQKRWEALKASWKGL